jgi:type IV pilus assembly protein PilC
MLFNYQAKAEDGDTRSGTIEAPSIELAVSSLQRRNLVIISLEPEGGKSPWYKKNLDSFERVRVRDVVILSRQLATLFAAKVPVIESLKVLGSETSNLVLRRHLSEALSDIQGGLSISQAFARHPEVFSNFYVSMVRSGEESGKLEEIFEYLADYLERSYDLRNKVKNALIYPAFVLGVFIIVMTLMLTVIVPRLSSILIESQQEIPLYTKIVIAFSDFLRKFGILFLLLLTVAGVLLWRYTRGEAGRLALSRFLIEMPFFGELYRKFYLSRLADNLETLLVGGVSMIRSLEISADVIGNEVYASIVRQSMEQVRSGSAFSEALSKYEEIPPLMVQMLKIGEGTGKLDFILKTLSRFYRREVDNTVDNLVNLIEPLLIIFLGLGVGVLVASVLIPIYNIAGSI